MDKRHLFSRALLFVAMVLLLGVAQARANVFSDFNEKEQQLYQNAIHFMDNGMVDTGIDMLKDLDKAHPTGRLSMKLCMLILLSKIMKEHISGRKSC